MLQIRLQQCCLWVLLFLLLYIAHSCPYNKEQTFQLQQSIGLFRHTVKLKNNPEADPF